MKKYTNNSQGLSLTEVLASLLILSIVSILLTGIFFSSTKTNIKQASSSKQLYDTSYTLKLITKDIRRTTEFKSTSINNYQLLHNSITKFSYFYDIEKSILYRSEEGKTFIPLATNVVNFEIKTNTENTNGLNIKLEIIDLDGQIQIGSTQVYFRK